SDYSFISKEMDRKKMGALIDDLIEKYGLDNIPAMLDKIKAFGFKYATVSGVTWGIDDVKVPEGKFPVIARAKAAAAVVDQQFSDGLLSPEERLRKHIEIWHGAKGEIEKLIPESLDKNGSVYDLVYSGARGSFSQITQMIGMKGLIQNTAGETIEFPIVSSMKEGLTPIEYFITTHGSRKGLTDTALNTAKAGYLTRKLFVVAQDLVIGEADCATKEGLYISKSSESGIEPPLAKNIKGRVLADDAVDEKGTVLFERNHLISKHDAVAIENAGVRAVKVRSPLTCKSLVGICAHCYGYDLGKNQLVGLGEAVGTVAAQAIGEPGTQLTMRTFHAGGTASVGGDITQGLPRVEELFEKRTPKNPALIAHVDGTVADIKSDGIEKVIYLLPELESKSKSKKKSDTEYRMAYNRTPLVKTGDKVKRGDLMTDGSADVDELFQYAGRDKTLDYIVREVSKPYELQGESVSRKHIEVILRQMFSRRKVISPGGTTLSTSEVIDQFTLDIENAESKEKGLEPAKTEAVVMGISEVSLSRKSFLSAASFQHTTRVLVAAAVRGSRDLLKGLMENVIIGRLIPAGTGFTDGPKAKMIEAARPKIQDDILDELEPADIIERSI
ncbi:MAG: DNA-directed RNA polymerase subunit beta', partial [Candidatus Taylorbacteria bacterium]|nr:DNA-directed RNA polymerase subunit beta' [Candidatus Taylorbacteria bacterium]